MQKIVGTHAQGLKRPATANRPPDVEGQTSENETMRGVPMLLAAGLLLSGCYESQDLLLDPGAARQPLAPGPHVLTDEDGKATRLRLTQRSDGWYEVERPQDGQASRKLLLNELGKDKGGALYAYATYDMEETAYIYGVLAIDADGRMREKTSDCHREADAKIAVETGKAKKLVDSCQFFRDDAGLMAALRKLAQNPKHWSRLE